MVTALLRNPKIESPILAPSPTPRAGQPELFVVKLFSFFDSCSYDYLEVYEDLTNNTDNDTDSFRRFCGDWSDKLKLLRYISPGPRLHLRFISDYSHSFSGYKAHVTIEQGKSYFSKYPLSLTPLPPYSLHQCFPAQNTIFRAPLLKILKNEQRLRGRASATRDSRQEYK